MHSIMTFQSIMTVRSITTVQSITTVHSIATLDIIPLTDFFTNYTFRTMLIGTFLIGGFAGALGSLLYLKKQSLIGDVIGHSSILGVALAFVIATGVIGIEGRSVLVLTIGAVIISTLCVLLANWIESHSRLGMDSAMAICLSLFYGAGMVAFRMISRSTLPNRGGIEKYVFGNAATLVTQDLLTILCFGAVSVAIMLALWKEIKVYIFDPVLAESLGFSSRRLMPTVFIAVTVAMVIGIKGVGLILMIAFAIMPAAAARQWTRSFGSMVTLSGIFGAFGGAFGSYVAVCLGKVPTGPVVVIVLAVIVAVSLCFSPQRSLFSTAYARYRNAKRARREPQKTLPQPRTYGVQKIHSTHTACKKYNPTHIKTKTSLATA